MIGHCASVRESQGQPTWILPQMKKAYIRLFELGYAHSAEAWQGTELVGGIYGVSLGRCFFGESMFQTQSNASKVALAALARFLEKQGFYFLDCQVRTGHMMRMGAKEVSREAFLALLDRALDGPTLRGKWAFSRNDPWNENHL